MRSGRAVACRAMVVPSVDGMFFFVLVGAAVKGFAVALQTRRAVDCERGSSAWAGARPSASDASFQIDLELSGLEFKV